MEFLVRLLNNIKKYFLNMKLSFNLALLLIISNFTYSQNTETIQQIDLELLKGNYKKAISITDSCLKLNASNILLYKNALACRLNYNYKKALTQTNILTNNEPNNTEFLLEHCRNLINLNSQEDAKDTLCLIFYDLDTTNINAGILLGKIYDHENSWADAVSLYSKLTLLDSENTYYLYHYAIALTNLKKGKEAIPILKNILILEPDHINSRYLLFRIYKALDKYELAVAQIDSIKRITPKQFKPYYELGVYNYVKNYNYKALPEFLKAIELGYPDDDGKHYVGKCYSKIKKYENALPYLKFTSHPPIQDFILLSTIAQCYNHLNKTDSALIFFEQAYKIAMPEPSFLDSYYNLHAKIHIDKGEYNEAIKCYNDLIFQTQNLNLGLYYKREAINDIADIYLKYLENPQKALELYKRILAETSEFHNPQTFKYYTQKIEKLNENIFFQQENN